MGKVVISTNMSLDGVVQDPDGAEGFHRGGWFARHGGSDLDAWREMASAEALSAGALLLGRRSHAWFASRWSERPGAWAQRLREMPKYVVTSTPLEARWENSTALAGDVAQEVARLKREMAGDLVVYASYQLARALMAHALVDELRLFVFPVVLGAGERLFGETRDATPLRLVSARALGHDLAFVTYSVVRDARPSEKA